jgi:hypothetical protein
MENDYNETRGAGSRILSAFVSLPDRRPDVKPQHFRRYPVTLFRYARTLQAVVDKNGRQFRSDVARSGAQLGVQGQGIGKNHCHLP